MKRKQKLIIPFISLKEGIHEFEFDVTSEFFEQFDHSIIEQADIHIDVLFNKKSTFFEIDFNLNGTIDLVCDRCADALQVEVQGKESLLVKFGDESFEETDEILIIPHGEHELNLSKSIYEYAHSLLPNKVVHKDESDCNQEVIEKLNELSFRKENKESDPRWDALSKLK